MLKGADVRVTWNLTNQIRVSMSQTTTKHLSVIVAKCYPGCTSGSAPLRYSTSVLAAGARVQCRDLMFRSPHGKTTSLSYAGYAHSVVVPHQERNDLVRTLL
jgi:hypothetical protein